MSLARLKFRPKAFLHGKLAPSLNLRTIGAIKPFSAESLHRPFSTAVINKTLFKNTLFFAHKKSVVKHQQRNAKFRVPEFAGADAEQETIVDEEELLEGEEGESSQSLLWRKDSELTPQEQRIKQWELWRSPFIAYQIATETNAALSEKTKVKIWETYKSDPKFWTLGNISGKFKIGKRRAYAIIVDKRHEEIEEIIEGAPLDATLLEKFEKEFSHFIFDELPEEMEDDDVVSKPGKPNYTFVDYEANQYRVIRDQFTIQKENSEI